LKITLKKRKIIILKIIGVLQEIVELQ